MYPPKLPEQPEQDFFACGEKSFNIIKKQLGVQGDSVDFCCNGWRFKLDTLAEPNTVAGVGPLCAAAAKEMSQLIKAGEA